MSGKDEPRTFPISGEEFERRIHRVSQMRELGLGLRRAAMQAWREGRSPWKPMWDIRSDPDYWRELMARK
ncbi:MAG: hypothetical protein NTX50_18315 [Candidatus Sumerlaeota bacterium]|nr:hypothetical protein [Candidatus Sumerlaeota bacterium]